MRLPFQRAADERGRTVSRKDNDKRGRKAVCICGHIQGSHLSERDLESMRRFDPETTATPCRFHGCKCAGFKAWGAA